MSRVILATLAAVLCAAVAAPQSRAEGLSPDELLARYQPVIVLDAREAFVPTAVDGFIAGSQLQLLGREGYRPVETDPAGLPVRGSGYRLDLTGCSPAAGLFAVSCYAAGADSPSVVYGRYDVRAGAIVLQYWLFYEDNFWSLQYPPTNLVWQAHEGDWEVVSVVLDAAQQPVVAAYSQHCTGERRSWGAVPKAGGDHPLVFVATGSHANLFAPGLHPISLACYPQAAVDFFRAFGVVPLDFNVPGRALGPGTTAVERVHDNAPRWIRFPGTWGEAQYIHAPAPIGTVAFGTSPVGPAFHDVWIDPLGTIARYPEG
jgi:hypothetical protein